MQASGGTRLIQPENRMMTTPYRTLITALAVVLLTCMTTSCSDPKPPAKLTKDSEACKVYHDYLNKQLTNLNGTFDNSLALPDMLKQAKPHLPTEMQRDAKLAAQYLEKGRSLAGNPDALRTYRRSAKTQGQRLSLLRVTYQIKEKCGGVPGNPGTIPSAND